MGARLVIVGYSVVIDTSFLNANVESTSLFVRLELSQVFEPDKLLCPSRCVLAGVSCNETFLAAAERTSGMVTMAVVLPERLSV